MVILKREFNKYLSLIILNVSCAFRQINIGHPSRHFDNIDLDLFMDVGRHYKQKYIFTHGKDSVNSLSNL